ncbi:citrate lyase alpha chain [Vibrio ishigakensis]|uniref:Citrate lyase alpha chain n=1 Tax=Vibrio ishigakensis TaxID=1481914 RepID=A0A0B8QL82_9VIBR|nr:citrate lyase alpha chain [Vibrio ishigakensis]
MESIKQNRKLRSDLKEAILASGLKDGDTISFHHAFRAGDILINDVVATIASMGFKDLTLASSSLTDCHAPLVEYVRSGVISKIFTSGIRGRLADEISAGIMQNPVEIHSHGGRVHLVQTGELSIDVAFLGTPSADRFGNANAMVGKSRCGSLAMPWWTRSMPNTWW